MPLRDGQRVCWQPWGPRGPQKAVRTDQGTVSVGAMLRCGPTDEPAWAVLWDTGEADLITPSGWCVEGSYDGKYRAIPVRGTDGNVR